MRSQAFPLTPDKPFKKGTLHMQTHIHLPNGYAIHIKREEISHVGRSIYRDFDKEQVVLEIVDPKGKVTKRLPIPASCAHDIAEVIA